RRRRALLLEEGELAAAGRGHREVVASCMALAHVDGAAGENRRGPALPAELGRAGILVVDARVGVDLAAALVQEDEVEADAALAVVGVDGALGEGDAGVRVAEAADVARRGDRASRRRHRGGVVAGCLGGSAAGPAGAGARATRTAAGEKTSTQED